MKKNICKKSEEYSFIEIFWKEYFRLRLILFNIDASSYKELSLWRVTSFNDKKVWYNVIFENQI